ncbi:FMN-binding negative transcriptional regulator [Jatrophihabitans sp. GAS493]|uniref:FMN-binding negative transcriptional regulator n=1 Tax=Jatrophihabitans sp. GAS493 TaxID=1907575 RepID=UPI000BB7CDB6|nr:FMN-binding negative transcriptional regulator [Jatrophihabitans sp. GAS493]
MYVPHHFAVSDEETQAMLASITAAELVTPTASGLVATFLPLLYDDQTKSLLGHFARANDHWSVEPTGDSLVIARGGDAYISPTWYAAKREHGRVVPTWNYSTLHVHGRLQIHDDVAWLEELVTQLTQRQESVFAQPWQVTDAPRKYIDGQLKAIVGVQLHISRVESKAKLGQNRSIDDQLGVVEGLQRADPHDTVALAMQQNLRVE